MDGFFRPVADDQRLVVNDDGDMMYEGLSAEEEEARALKKRRIAERTAEEEAAAADGQKGAGQTCSPRRIPTGSAGGDQLGS